MTTLKAFPHLRTFRPFIQPHSHSVGSQATQPFTRFSGHSTAQAFFTLLFIVSFLVFQLTSCTAHAAQVTLAWDANTESDLAGYKIHYGTTSNDYTFSIDVGNVTSTTVDGLADGLTYYFAATAYNTSEPPLESTYSNEVSTSTCTYSIYPASAQFGATGGTGTIQVTTQTGCSWTANSSAPWQTITSGSSGSGSGVITYSVSANTAADSRTAVSTFAKKSFTVSQTGNQTYTISASAGVNGTISPAGSVSVNNGAGQTYTITPNSGYKISNVTVDGASVGAIATYAFSNVTANHSIVASFMPITYTISSSAATGGSISPSGTVSVASGASQVYAITPASDYRIADVLVDGSSVGAVSSYTFTNVTAGHTITASFRADTYTITASTGTGGSISPSGTVSVASGASQVYAITPASGYRIADVLVDGSSVGAVSSYTFTNVTAGHTIITNFSANATYSLAISKSGSGVGTVTTSPAGSSFSPGTIITLAATPDASSTFTGWSGACTGTSQTCTITMSSNVSVTATFTVKTFTIRARSKTGGNVSPYGEVVVPYGQSKTFTIVPDSGYNVKNVKVNGTQLGAVTSYTASNVTEDQNVLAEFVWSGVVLTRVSSK